MNFDVLPKWLIIYFIKDIQLFRPQIKQLEEEFLSLKYTKNIEFYIIKEYITVTNDENHLRQNINYELVVSKIEYTKTLGATRLEVKPKNISLNEKNSWKKLLPYLLQNTKAEHKIFVTNSHGNAFGVYDDFSNKTNFNIKSNSKLIINNKKAIDGFSQKMNFGDLSLVPGLKLGNNGELVIDREKTTLDCTYLELIWVKEIADVLNEGIKSSGKKIDIIMMNNCFMQLYDNGILFRDVADFLAAPQKRIDVQGFDMPGVLNLIINNPQTHISQILDLLVLGFKNDTNPTAVVRSCAVSVNRLSPYTDLLEITNNLTASLIKNIDILSPIILNSFQKIRKLDDTEVNLSLIDLNFFLFTISSEWENDDFKSLFDEFNKILHSIVEGRIFIGKDVINSDATSVNKYSPNGISICFPRSMEIFKKSQLLQCNYWGGFLKSKFPELSNWDDFLNLLFRLSNKNIHK